MLRLLTDEDVHGDIVDGLRRRQPALDLVRVQDVGLRPVYVGEDQERIVDGLFQLWIALAITQGRGRRLAFRLLEG